MAHGVRQEWAPQRQGKAEGKAGSRRIFSPQFKLQVLDSYRRDPDCRGNQRATARKYGIHRRQIQKWLQMESSLRCTAMEQGETVALNLANGRQHDVGSPCSAGSIPHPEPLSPSRTVSRASDSDDDLSSSGSLYYQDKALDFTCETLSKKNFYSLSFKIQVVEAYHHENNTKSVAKKFGVHWRQVEQWLEEEDSLRNEVSDCLDLSKKRRLETFDYEEEVPSPKKTFIDLDVQEQPSSAQETALCLIKHFSPTPEVTSSMDTLYRPYTMCCSFPDPAPFDQWNPQYYPYYGSIQTSYVTKWLQDDEHYYKQAKKDINLYSMPLYS